MKKLMTRKPAATSTKVEATSTQNDSVNVKPSTSTASTANQNQENQESNLQNLFREIQKKLGSKFTIDEIKREYELCENDEKKTLINLLKQKEEEEETMKRNLFKRIEEAHAPKALTNIELKENSKSYLLETLENIYQKTQAPVSSKKISLPHRKLQEIKDNFSKPSPDQIIHINRND